MEENHEKKYNSEEILAKIVEKAIHENRMKRWMTFMVSILIFSYLTVNLMNSMKEAAKGMGDHITMVSIKGAIGEGKATDAHDKIKLIKKAMDSKDSKALVLRMNSGGGSPVHAKMIYDQIKLLKAEHPEKSVYAVVEDMCASACYYIASAADEIVVSPESVIGSIGVRMDSWDVTGLMTKLGVKNDTLHSGKNKLLIDPFHKKDPKLVKYLTQKVLAPLHHQFISDVKQGRPKLSTLDDDNDVFSGLVYAGRESVKIGVSDKIGDIYSVQRDISKKQGKTLEYKNTDPTGNLLQKILSKAQAVYDLIPSM